MRVCTTHSLSPGQELILTHSPREYLALVDIETYPCFVAPEIDHLDMLSHLFTQMKALTAVAWGAPGAALNIRFLLTEEDALAENLAAEHWGTFASGWVRTGGEVCFTSHLRLFDCARHAAHALLREEKMPRHTRPQVLAIPPGVYSISIFYHLSPLPKIKAAGMRKPRPKIHFTVVLRRYAFPGPRVAPVRLPGLIPWTA